jgi:hypothetical protein
MIERKALMPPEQCVEFRVGAHLGRAVEKTRARPGMPADDISRVS